MRILLLLLLVLVAFPQSATAQRLQRRVSTDVVVSSPFHHVSLQAGDSLSNPLRRLLRTELAAAASQSAVTVTPVRVQREDSWKAGAAIGGMLGGGMGFAFGLVTDNLINEGTWSVGGHSIGFAFLGASVGALAGGLVGWQVQD
jgi:hypothetical protein